MTEVFPWYKAKHPMVQASVLATIHAQKLLPYRYEAETAQAGARLD